MRHGFRRLDEILRGDATRMSRLHQGRIDVPIGGLSVVVTALAVIYGACMGSFSVIRTGGTEWMQVVGSAVKLPLLFFLTLVVTFPSLYVFNALVGSRLTLLSTLRLLIAMLGVILAVLASLGPIIVFFGISTTSYPFMKLLNVIVCTVSGLMGLAFLLRTLHRLVLVQDLDEAGSRADPGDGTDDAGGEDVTETGGGALDLVDGRTSQKASAVFKIWVVMFALVGAQMGWVLRPFIGSPSLPFAWFRGRESNFFVDVFDAIGRLFAGG